MRTLIGLIVICGAVSALGCGAQRCSTERAVVSAVDAGIGAADAAMGDEIDGETQEALRIAAGVAGLGRAAVGACELLRDGGGWQQWVALALEAAGGVLAHFTGAADASAVEAPPELLRAVELLEAEAAP